MTKKDYVLIAKAISKAKRQVIALNTHSLGDAFLAGINQTQLNLSNAFADDNPNFDRVKFDLACYAEAV